ncbi:MAG: mandelate racemase/muconate lactonizing enzyme family protein [Granulosicoccus sp.]
MSCITRFSAYSHCNDLGGRLWNPAIKWTKKYAVFVVLEDEKGIRGLGECWCFDSSPDALLAYLRTEVAPQIIGLDLSSYESVLADLTSRATLTARHGILASAMAGVDIAIWDLRSRDRQVPLWRYLDSGAIGDVQLYASGGLYGQDKDDADLASEMINMVEAGFSIVKMKVGALALDDDLRRVFAVLDALPEHIRLIVDGVYSYSFEQALALYQALPKERIDAFQAPVAADDTESMSRLCRLGVPVMGIEAEYRQEIHKQLVVCRAVKYLQSAPIAYNGLSGMIALCEQLSDTALQLSLEVSSTAVATLAACHFAAAFEQVAHVEYHYVHQVFFDQLPLSSSKQEFGRFELPNTPGLGIVLLEGSVVEAFTIARTSL